MKPNLSLNLSLATLAIGLMRPGLTNASATFTADVEAYCRYDLTGEPGRLRSRVVEAAVRADNRDQVVGKPFADALGRLTRPTPVLTAPAGFYGDPPPLYPAEYVAAGREPLHNRVQQARRGRSGPGDNQQPRLARSGRSHP